jgi:hypothetical protein
VVVSSSTVHAVLDECFRRLEDVGQFTGDYLDKNLIRFCFTNMVQVRDNPCVVTLICFQTVECQACPGLLGGITLLTEKHSDIMVVQLFDPHVKTAANAKTGISSFFISSG